jgi:hypothetical protein
VQIASQPLEQCDENFMNASRDYWLEIAIRMGKCGSNALAAITFGILVPSTMPRESQSIAAKESNGPWFTFRSRLMK